MIKLCDKDNCTGCAACMNICPYKAIKTYRDEKGFWYPDIDQSKCRSCKLCVKVCPILNKSKRYIGMQSVYACWSKTPETRYNSSSGGLFYELAVTVLNNGGVVCGAAFDSDFKVKHTIIDRIEQLHIIQGSKYVQSDTTEIYIPLSEHLKQGRTVLCSGTPCQIDGIVAYLHSKEINCNNLYTCDLICHGCPSPAFWDKYKDSIQRKYKSRLSEFDFRYKQPGWMVFSAKAKFENEKEYICNTNKDKFLRAFLYDYIIRENCQRCPYTNTNRVSDITMADFWGYQDNEEYSDDDKGISLAIVNTEKGRWLFEETKSNMVFIEKTLQEAVNGNRSLSKPWPANPNTDLFWKDYFSKGYRYVCWKYLKPVKQSNWKNKWRAFKYDLKILPNRVLLTILGKDNYNRLKDKLKR